MSSDGEDGSGACVAHGGAVNAPGAVRQPHLVPATQQARAPQQQQQRHSTEHTRECAVLGLQSIVLKRSCCALSPAQRATMRAQLVEGMELLRQQVVQARLLRDDPLLHVQ